MIKKENITGIILAGGKSSRMGTDKGLLEFRGNSFMSYVIDALKPLVNTLIIVSNNPGYDKFGCKRVSDIIEHSGPLGGLHTGLSHSKTENNLVLSCDIPLINKHVLELLIRNFDNEKEVIQLESKGKTMPLIALYKTSCKNKCEILLNSGEKRLRVAVNQFKTKTISINSKLDQHVKNINTKEQLNDINYATEH